MADASDRRMSPEEMAAYQGIMAGDLEPLGDLLALQEDRLHPLVQRRLLMLIEGHGDYQLEVKPLKAYNRTIGFRRAHRALRARLTDRMIELGANKRGHLDRAAYDVVQEPSFRHLNEATARRYYLDERKMRARLKRFMDARSKSEREG